MSNAAGAAPAVRRARRTDPDRRNRIIDAAVDVIADRGVAGTTVRLIARAADVPLGSLTYHFDGLDELFLLAFERVAEHGSETFAGILAGHADDPAEGVARIIENLVAGDTRELVLMVELYSLALRRPEYRVLTQRWMDTSRTSLAEHLPADIAAFVDVFIEGATLHAALSTEPYDVTGMRAAIRRLTAG
ncbi:TetR family transcriptional regulator [Serinibacter arcticus]|uniref:TetR family transcriptional regulator n=1 Tax=Serinibacter arcticus TaxID=1655435 RepID=A0A2U1ZZD6_9MICO|nr:TetR family transcriptional regulator [Serinibacter arcticus]PWD52293.1 TetR family transcriptional regulator [Serinibacter arcticus]